MTIANQQAVAFIDDMQLLLSKPGFPRLARYNQERNWSAYLNLQEGHYCSILEWLLAPEEGHGLGDFFLKRLLAEANTVALSDPQSVMTKRFSQRLNDETWLGIDKLFINPLHSAIVEREVVINTGKRIDLLVVDPLLMIVVAIERKDGSSVHSDQLPCYQEWVEATYPNYYQLFILSDSQGRDHQLDNHPDWIQLDDSWVVNALKDALIPGRLPADMHQRLEDLLYRFDTVGSYRDPFFLGIEKEMSHFALENRAVIQRLRQSPISLIDRRGVLTTHLPDVGEDTELCRALLLICRYQTVLTELLALDSLNSLSDRLTQRLPDASLAFEPYDEALHIGTQGMQAAYEAGEITDWPVYVSLVIPHQPSHTPEECLDTEKPTLPTLALTLDLLARGEDQKDEVRALAKYYGLTSKPRWAIKRLELPSEAVALNDLGRLTPWIQEMCAMARTLGY